MRNVAIKFVKEDDYQRIKREMNIITDFFNKEELRILFLKIFI